MEKDFKEGEEVEYKWTKNGKWYKGRIDRIQPQKGWKAIYSIQKFGKCKIIDWETVLEGIERGKKDNFIDTQGKDCFKVVEDWYFVKWFSKDYLRKIKHTY